MADGNARIGNWLQTIGGRAFYPIDPRPEDVDVQDIAHALAHVCRFGGHCRRFYSVAEHSVRVSVAIADAGGTVEEQFAGLMHDAAEAYVGDMVWPLKMSDAVDGYRRVEGLVEGVLSVKFGFALPLPPIVKHFDLVMLATEKRDLMSDGPGREDGAAREASAARAKLGKWHCDDLEPLDDTILPWPSVVARERFLDRFAELEAQRRDETITNGKVGG